MNADLLQDLVRYKHYKDRSVMMAARSLIALFRNTIPEMLHKKDRGRPTEATVTLETQKYGEIAAFEFIPGADVLLDNNAQDSSKINADSDVSKFMN